MSARRKRGADIKLPIGPAHAVYFGTYEIVKDLAGGNVDDGHHPVAAGKWPLGIILCLWLVGY
jgi:hypothetical protein